MCFQSESLFEDKTPKAFEVEEKPMSAVIMGRKTWDSIPASKRPLSQRINIVVTSKAGELLQQEAKHLRYVSDLESGFHILEKEFSARLGEVFVIGGSSLYDEAFTNYRDRIKAVYLTRIGGDFECDTFFRHSLDPQ